MRQREGRDREDGLSPGRATAGAPRRRCAPRSSGHPLALRATASSLEGDATVAHVDRVRQARGDRGVVGDEDEGCARGGAGARQEGHDLTAGRLVEGTRGLIRENHRGIGGERATDRDALGLAARELAGPVGAGAVEAEVRRGSHVRERSPAISAFPRA